MDAADSIIAYLKTHNVSTELRDKLDTVVFLTAKKVVAPEMRLHSSSLSQDYTNVSKLDSLDSKSFLRSCSPTLITFIEGCTGRSLDHVHDTKELFRYAVMVECLYHIKNNNLILPHCFVVNLIEKTVSGSKSVTSVNGKLMPGAGDTTMRDWWKTQGTDVLTLPPSKFDLAIWFDNVGKYIVKSYRVKAERNATPTVVTATQSIMLSNVPGQSMLQCSLPTYTKQGTLPEIEIQQLMINKREKSICHFRQYRQKFVSSVLQYMLKSTEMDKIIRTEISKLEESHLTRQCLECGKLFPPRKIKCDACHGHVTSIQTEDHVYENFSNKLPKFFQIGQRALSNVCKIQSFEPVLLNPNSTENVTGIVDEVKEEAIDLDSPEGRKWIFIGGDGPPVALMRRIKRSDPEKYAWLAILTGKGHLKMNMLKSIFKLGDKIMFNVFAQEVLKFDTAKSYQYFIDCKDNHKSYQALEIFLIGTTMELIRLYSSQIEEVPTAAGFLEWTANTSDPTLKFVCQFTLNFVLAAYVTRIGDRHNDVRCSNAGRMKFFDLWFALNHPIYRENEYNDLREQVLYNDQVLALRDRNTTFSNGANDFNHQCGDFKLEERVKTMKKLSPKGKMDKQMWQRVARGMDEVNGVIQHGQSLLHMKDDHAARITPIENEVVKWRALLRNSKYLSSNRRRVYTMDGKPLDEEFSHFMATVAKKRELYFDLALTENLESIRYDNLKVEIDGLYDSDDEISPYTSDGSSDEEEL